MALNRQNPILYLITSGETTPATSPESPEFARLLDLIRAALDSGIDLIQLREKRMKARVVYELARRAALLARRTSTRILVNDRADIARAAQCSGVHLTTRSLPTHIVRQTFGPRFLIGVSTHTREEVLSARDEGADFAVFGPIYATPSKLQYGLPLGLEKLSGAARTVKPFPLIAIGGINPDNARAALRNGASGVAAIRMFTDARELETVVRRLRV